MLHNRDAYSTQHSYNLEQATQLVQLSGAEQRIELLFSTAEQGDNARLLAEVYKDMMAQIGIDVVLFNAPNRAEYRRRLGQRTFEVAFVLYDDLDHFYELNQFFKPRAPLNHSGFTDPYLTDKLSELERTLGFDEVGRLTREVHQIIDLQAPLSPLFTIPRRAYYSPALRPVNINPESYYSTFYKVGIAE